MAISVKPRTQSTIPNDDARQALGYITTTPYNEGSEIFMETARLLGRVTPDSGSAEELTAAQVRTFLNLLATAQTWTAAQKFARVSGAIATTSGTALNNANGNEHTRTVAANTTFTVSGVPASGDAFHMRLLLTYTSGTITWFSGVNWVGGTAPTFTGGKKYEIVFSTENGGTTWRAAAGEYAA